MKKTSEDMAGGGSDFRRVDQDKRRRREKVSARIMAEADGQTVRIAPASIPSEWREKGGDLMAVVKAVTTYRKLLAFGKQYGVAEEEDYKAAIKTYAEQAALIATMRNQLAEDGMTVEKEYVKGRANVCVHPLVQEIPKHVDSANRTLGLINDIIVKRGKAKPPEKDALSEFRL